MIKKISFLRGWLILFAAVGFHLWTHAAFAEQVVPTTASSGLSSGASITYSVSANGFRVGRVQTRLQRSGADYLIESITKPRGLASLLLRGSLIDKCEFTLNADKSIQGRLYSSHKKGRAKYNNSLSYDWLARKIVTADHVTSDIPKGYLLDNCNFYFAAAMAHGETLKNSKIVVLDAKDSSKRSYLLNAIEQETIATKFGELETHKLTLLRENNPHRSLTFWLSEFYPMSPVKIVEQRKRRKVILKLTSYTDS